MTLPYTPYTPEFKCPHCGEVQSSQINGDVGLVVLCGCKESRDAWEKEHRADMERRKNARRGLR